MSERTLAIIKPDAVEPHGFTAVAPIRTSAEPAEAALLRQGFGGHPLRIPPRLDSCGFLRRRVKKNVIGDIIGRYEAAGLIPIAMRMMNLSKRDAEGFYAVHKQRPFFGSPTSFIASGPIVVLVLAGEECHQEEQGLNGCYGSSESRTRHHPSCPWNKHRM